MTLTPEQLAHIRATALAAVDGWSPTSSRWTALEHCAASHPQAVVALCDEVTAARGEVTPGAAIKAFAALVQATYLDGLLSDETRDDWRGLASNGRVEVDAMRKGLRALEAERDGMAKALELARAALGRVRDVAHEYDSQEAIARQRESSLVTTADFDDLLNAIETALEGSP